MEQKLVLVVDEEPHILKAFRNFLGKENCQMIGATNVREVNNILSRHRIDLLIFGISSSESAMIQTIRKIKEKFADLPIIVMSAFTEIRYRQDFRDLQIRFLAKPIDIYELRRAVYTVMQE